MGALTLKTFSDELREWELIESEGIDPTDSFGVDLRLSIREDQIYLAEPLNPSMPWITDKGRLFFDGLFEKNISVEKTNWKDFFTDFSELVYFVDHLNLHKKNILSLIFVFDNVSLETLNMLYILDQSCSFVKLKTVEKSKVENDLECKYQLADSTGNAKLHMSTLGLLVGTNPRYEGYLLNLSLRQRFLKGNFKLLSIGPALDLTVPVYNLGSNLNVLKSIGEGTHLLCQDIKNAEFPILVTNMEFYKRSDSGVLNSVFKYINMLDTAWNSFSVLNPNLSSTGMYSLNKFLHLSSEDITNFFGLYAVNTSLTSISNVKSLTELYLLKNFTSKISFQSKSFISQTLDPVNDSFYEKAKGKIANSYFHLPVSMVYEDNETYLNTQGLLKRMGKLLDFKKDAKTNWQLTRKLYSSVISLTFYNNQKDNQLVQFDCVNSFNFKNYLSFQYSATQTLTSLSYYLIKQNSPIIKSLNSSFKDTRTKTFDTKIKYWLDDFFNTNGRDSFSYNSSVLANCSKVLRSSSTNFF
jgi:NADH dehydrogenase/NADH:ubiquinone oxidoreductase subunit G